jgi:hypothetical protein
MSYDLLASLQSLMQGLVVQNNMIDAAQALGRPITSADVTTILADANTLNAATVLPDFMPTTEPNYPTTLPAYPTQMPRFPDANGGMTTPDGWNLTFAGKVVQG